MKLGNVCSILNGFAFRSEKYVHEGIRIIRISNVQKGYIEDKVPAFYPYNSKEAIKYELECGDILISLTGNVGRVAILTAEFLPATLNQRVACLRIKNESKLDKSFLFNYLNSDRFEQQCIVSSKGVAQKNMSTEWLKEYEMPDLSIKQQKEISQILSELSALILCDKRQLAKLDELVKSRFVEMFGDIQETVPLSYYIRGLSAGKSLAGEDECINKVLKTGATTYDYFDSTQVKNLPLDYIPQEEHRVKTGDVIISRMNTAELVGAAAYVWKAPDHTYLPDRLWKAEVRNTACPIFVWQLLIQKDTKESIRRIASGTSGSMKNISKPGVLGIRVIKVEIAAQNRFAAFVAEVDKSKLAVKQSLEKLENLKKSLMQQYFG